MLSQLWHVRLKISSSSYKGWLQLYVPERKRSSSLILLPVFYPLGFCDSLHKTYTTQKREWHPSLLLKRWVFVYQYISCVQVNSIWCIIACSSALKLVTPCHLSVNLQIHYFSTILHLFMWCIPPTELWLQLWRWMQQCKHKSFCVMKYAYILYCEVKSTLQPYTRFADKVKMYWCTMRLKNICYQLNMEIL